jgi:hypothetical protein
MVNPTPREGYFSEVFKWVLDRDQSPPGCQVDGNRSAWAPMPEDEPLSARPR